MHAASNLPPARRRSDDERATIDRGDLTRHEAPGLQPVENARERRAFVGEPAVQLRDAGRARGRQVRENVGFALRQAVLTQIGQVKADPVRRSMDGRDKTKRHQE